MVLMGSRAIRLHFPDFPREPKDWDYISNMDFISSEVNGKRTEIYDIPPLFKRFDNVTRDVKVLSPDELYTLKVSHIFWDIKWEKTMFDIVWLHDKGCNLDMELFKELYEWWEGVHGANHRSNLMLTREEFFDNGLKGDFDHDYLHTLINPEPMFTKILVEPNGVDCSEEKWNDLSFDDKLELIREETYVMAYERLAGRSWLSAYKWQLKQMITGHLTMYEALFAIENYRLLERPKINFKELLDEKLCRN